jgi:thiol-disulfide isomerase/thioredoxin
MTYRFYPLLPLILALCLSSTQVLAKHEANEPTDGTVNSFRWLENPLTLDQVPIHSEEGVQVTLSQFKGKIVLLNLWASWCLPCVRELPALDRLQKRLGGEDFVVVAVSLDSDPDLARKLFIDQLSIEHLKLYIEPAEQIGRFFPVDVLPASFFIDRKGQAIGLLRSYVEWDDAHADTLINRLVAGVATTTLRAEKAQRDQAQ